MKDKLRQAQIPAMLLLVLATAAVGYFVIAPFVDSDEPQEGAGPPVVGDPANGVRVADPALFVPAAMDEGEPAFHDNQVRVKDYLAALHGTFVLGATYRDSEMGHGNYQPDFAGAPMEAMAQQSLAILAVVEESFLIDGELAEALCLEDDAWYTCGEPRLRDYASAGYVYHLHHMAERWDEHGLDTQLTFAPVGLMAGVGNAVFAHHYADGHFYHDPGHADLDGESMAYGLDAIHPHYYAWIRWASPDGEGDMGALTAERLAGQLGNTPGELLGVSREIVGALDEAWDEERRVYDFGNDGVWELEAVASLIRGHKVLYEFLYQFGEGEEDAEAAWRLFQRSATMLDGILELAEPWGIPGAIGFTTEGTRAASDTVDVAGVSSFITHLTGGYGYLREREGERSALLAETHRPDLVEAIGEFTDAWLEHALDGLLDDDGHIVNTVAYDDGSILERGPSARAAGYFLAAAGNSYLQGESFEPPLGWNEEEAAVVERSERLYDLMQRQGELIRDQMLLETFADLPAEPTPSEPTPSDPAATLPEEPRVGVELIADGLTAPLDMAAPDDGSGRLFVAEQSGTIRVITADGELREAPFLDLRDRIRHPNPDLNFDERGLLGVALHPDFADNGRFFVYYSTPLRAGAPVGWNHTSRLSEFTVSAEDEHRADPGSERIILQVDQPGISHNAGHIRFGPDGYLYVPLGDGAATAGVGEGHTPEIGNAQDRTNLLGSVLRIDVDDEGDEERAYGIPPDNPFIGVEDARPEVWAYGLRNPFDISFDPENEYGLLIADAGEALFEWVNMSEGGENFGWSIREGSNCFDPQQRRGPVPEECPDEGPFGEPLVDPVVEYARADYGTVVVGAQIYRGNELDDLQGRMVVADWSIDGGPNGVLFVAAPGNDGSPSWEMRQVEIVSEVEGFLPGTINRYIMTLGRDQDGELYLLTNAVRDETPGGGALYRVVAPGE